MKTFSGSVPLTVAVAVVVPPESSVVMETVVPSTVAPLSFQVDKSVDHW